MLPREERCLVKPETVIVEVGDRLGNVPIGEHRFPWTIAAFITIVQKHKKAPGRKVGGF